MLATDQLLKRVVNTWLLVAHTRARTVQTQSAQGGIKMILRILQYLICMQTISCAPFIGSAQQVSLIIALRILVQDLN